MKADQTLASGTELEAALRLIGAPNFRDLGGIPTRDGRRVRNGQIFRSDDLSRLTTDDFEILTPLAIRLICDLRGAIERTERPSRWPEALATERLHANLSPDLQVGHGFHGALLQDDPSADNARLMMLETYRRLPKNSMAGIRSIFGRLAAGELPALIHCTAGKDRTGFICACLLHTLGASPETIMSDYLVTVSRLDLDMMAASIGGLLQQMLHLQKPLPRAALDVINSVVPEFLIAAFDAVDAQFGSMDQYLQAAGIDAALRLQLQDQLLETGAV